MLPMLYDRSSGRSPVSLIEEMRRDMDRLMEQAFRDERRCAGDGNIRTLPQRF